MKRTTLATVCVVFAISLSTSSFPSLASAQENPILKPGTRMRAWMILPDSNVWVGRLVLLDNRYLDLRLDSVIRLRLDRIERLEKSRGKSAWLTLGLPLAGAALGAIVAPILMEESLACRTGAVDQRECGSEAPKPLIGAAVGAIVFMLVGNLVAEERWVELDISEYEGSVGLKLGARVRFRVGK